MSLSLVRAIFYDPSRAARQFPVPVLQCLQIKTLEAKGPAPGAPDRYRIILSDSQNYVQCMLATQANHVVHDGLLQRFCLVRLRQFQAQSLKGRKCVRPAARCEALPPLTGRAVS